jgi:toxin ParE1/3/4
VKLIWSDDAIQERNDILDYISADNPVVALTMDELFSERARNLLDFPDMGRPGMLPETRELTVHPNYRLVYELVGGDVHILNVVHARRDWPEG